MDEGARQQEDRYLRSFPDEDGKLVVQARLTPEVGAVLLKAIEVATEELYQRSRDEDSSGESTVPAEQRRADALELVVESALEKGLDPGTAGDRYQVVVHVDADVAAETSRRLACDSSRVVMRHGSDGRVLNLGRKTRAIHPALRRALQHRDGGCRFPGCGSQICDAHHVEPWAEGGKTELDSLLLLCRFQDLLRRMNLAD